MFDEILRLLNTSAMLRDLQIIELIVYGQNAWHDTATPMMAQPRTPVQYSYVFETDAL